MFFDCNILKNKTLQSRHTRRVKKKGARQVINMGCGRLYAALSYK